VPTSIRAREYQEDGERSITRVLTGR
jgi:hypothetical protein